MKSTRFRPEILRLEDRTLPSQLVTVLDAPSDADFTSQWALNNTGQTAGTPDADIDATEAWNVMPGRKTIVAVIDSGIDYTHPDLINNIWTNPGETPDNGIDDDRNGFIDDVHGWDFFNNDNDPMDDLGHGTFVAGVIGAEHNDIGVAGVNGQVVLMPIKFIGKDGYGTIAAAVKAIRYAFRNGAMISNNSWGTSTPAGALRRVIEHAARRQHLFVAASGNNPLMPSYPAAYKLSNILSVGATDHNDELAAFSFRDKTTDLLAPGVDIYSTASCAGDLGNPDGYLAASGTSAAAPHVAGVASMIYDGKFKQTIKLLKETADNGRLNMAVAIAVKHAPPANAANLFADWLQLTEKSPFEPATQDANAAAVEAAHLSEIHRANLETSIHLLHR